jgi:hypothetical protein
VRAEKTYSTRRLRGQSAICKIKTQPRLTIFDTSDGEVLRSALANAAFDGKILVVGDLTGEDPAVRVVAALPMSPSSNAEAIRRFLTHSSYCTPNPWEEGQA